MTPGTARNAASTPQKHPAAKVAFSMSVLPTCLVGRLPARARSGTTVYKSPAASDVPGRGRAAAIRRSVHGRRDLERVDRAAACQVVHRRPDPDPAVVLAGGADQHLVAGRRADRPEVARIVGRLNEGAGGERLAGRPAA